MKKLVLAFVFACAAVGVYAGTDSWTYDSGAKTLTWGDNVVVNVTANNKNLTIGDNKSNELAVDLDFSKPIDDGYSLVTINGQAFCQNAAVIRFIAPESLRTINWEAFSTCVNLEEVKMNDGFTTFQQLVFQKCSKLTKVVNPMPTSITAPSYSIYSSSAVTGDVIVHAPGEYKQHFTSAANVTSLRLVNASKISGYACFSGMNALTNITLSAQFAEIGSEGRILGDLGKHPLTITWNSCPKTIGCNSLFTGTTAGCITNYIPWELKAEWEALAANPPSGHTIVLPETEDGEGTWTCGTAQVIKWRHDMPPRTQVTTLMDAYPTGPVGSLRAALAAAEAGDTITFAPYLAGGKITIVGVDKASADTSIVVDKAVTIQGPEGGVVIDGGWNGVSKSDAGGRIFLIPADLGQVKIRNLTLQNGHGRGWNKAGNQYFDGGAVYALSPVKFENCSFINNCTADETAYAPSGTGARGGGAISAVADVEIVSCFFGTNCIPTGSSSHGGAIRQAGGTLTVTDTVFDHDYSATYGGGVAYLGSAVTGATFKNCKFIENSSVVANGVAGGAIFAEMADNSALKFFDCVFRGGSGANQGGAVYCTHNVALVAVNCEFTDSYSPFGGAVYANATKPLLFVNCTFLANAANTWGGAFEITDKDLCLVNCTVAGSYCAGNQGGGLYAAKGLHLLNTVFGYNYWGQNMDFNDGNQNENTCLRSLYKGKSTAPFGATYTLATSLEDVDSATKLFANYQMVSDMHGAGATGARVVLPKAVVMPTFAEDPKALYPSRVIGIAKDSVLNGTGYPVRANADYSYVEYSEDEGATWKQFFKLQDGVDTANMTPITADQRGVAYYNGKTPIGAATVVAGESLGLLIIVR